jgi:guanylate kinase
MSFRGEFDAVIVNDKLEATLAKAEEIVRERVAIESSGS